MCELCINYAIPMFDSICLCVCNVVNYYHVNDIDLIEILQKAKTNSDNASSKSSQESSDDRSEEMTNPMDSSGVDQLLARVLSNAGVVNKTIAPPSANRFMPSPVTIEETAGMHVHICSMNTVYSKTFE